MAEPREPWNIRPARKRAAVSASLKAEVETKAKALIEKVLKPRHRQQRVGVVVAHERLVDLLAPNDACARVACSSRHQSYEFVDLSLDLRVQHSRTLAGLSYLLA